MENKLRNITIFRLQRHQEIMPALKNRKINRFFVSEIRSEKIYRAISPL